MSVTYTMSAAIPVIAMTEENSIPRFKGWKPWGGDAAHSLNPETGTEATQSGGAL